jgi:membrane-bound ClpP family serine protease
MNQELQNQIASLVEAAKQAGSDAATFIQEQAPELCQQIIAWETTISWVGVIGFGLLMLLGLVLFFTSMLKDWDDAGFVGAFTGLIGLIGLGFNLYNLVKVLTAPKLVLIEAITGLLK